MSAESFSPWLAPLGRLFQATASARNSLYDRGWLQAIDCGRPVVSIGNLTAGGTGKTPFTALLASELVKSGHRPAVISRGYRAELETGGGRVELGVNLRESVRRFGDEPVLLAHALKRDNIPVYVGRDKVAVASLAVQTAAPGVLIADDAFQHRRLRRCFDVVLLDPTEPWWHFRPLPAGRMREPFTSLARAQAVVFSKVNLAEPERLGRLRDSARMNVDSAHLPAFVEIEYRLPFFTPLAAFLGRPGEQGEIAGADLGGARLLLLSAIGRPRAFCELVTRETGATVVEEAYFSDHHFFSASELAGVAGRARKARCTHVVVTEKDAVKLDPDADWPVPVLVSRLRAVPVTGMDEMYARLVGSFS